LNKGWSAFLRNTQFLKQSISAIRRNWKPETGTSSFQSNISRK